MRLPAHTGHLWKVKKPIDMNQWKNFSKGLLKENTVFALFLGMCPTLAVTTSAVNGLGMCIWKRRRYIPG